MNDGSIELPYPDTLEIHPLAMPPVASIEVPGSKSLTNRALVLAALASANGQHRESVLENVLRSEDTLVMVDCLQRLGFTIRCDWPSSRITITASCGKIPNAEADLFVANSGTTMRFLTALVALGKGRYRLDGVQRMRERPIQDLLAALQQLGVRARSELDNGCPPVVVESDGVPGGTVHIRGDVSSQFLSGMLMAAPLARGAMVIEVDGPLVSWPYVAMTLQVMRDFGARIEVSENHRQFQIPAPQSYQARSYHIEPDASAASYFAAAAAITGGQVTLPGLTGRSLQGDVRFFAVLAKMGCKIDQQAHGTTVQGSRLVGVDVDMNDISDTVMTLAVVACFAEGPTIIRNVAHIRFKETDRIGALATELRRLGAMVDEFDDGLRIVPRALHGAQVEVYNDHRMAMSLALAGLRVPGVIVKNPGCVAKTYPNYFKDLERLQC